MRARRLDVGVRSGAERAKALREASGSIARGDHTPQRSGLFFESVEELRRILTEKRLQLLLAIARHRPASLNQLAKLVRRDYKNVCTDVTLLQRLGLVTLKAPAKGRAQKPTVPYDEIRVTIDLRQPHETQAA